MKTSPKALFASYHLVEPIDWESVYQSQLPRIYNYFLYKVGDREFAEDLTATTFERAWKLRSRYRASVASLPTWLFGIARNALKEHLRNYKKTSSRQEAFFGKDELLSVVDIEKDVQQRQEKELLRKLLLELPEREQDIIALKYGGELTNREIAKITHLTESNVGSILHRTVKKIRARLEDHSGR